VGVQAKVKVSLGTLLFRPEIDWETIPIGTVPSRNVTVPLGEGKLPGTKLKILFCDVAATVAVSTTC
jgi:hypothetical protein